MSFYIAFLLGLLSSAHCIGMCGGLLGALNQSTPIPLRTWRQNQFHLLANNLGRISIYMLAGAIMGYVGASIGAQLGIPQWSLWLRRIMGVLMLIIGIQLLFKWEGWFRLLENINAPLWKKLSNHLIQLIQSNRLTSSYKFGLIWGLIPCGLVYSVLLTATSSGSSINGILTMLGFGLGTLPALLLTGQSLWWYKKSLGTAHARQASGAILVIAALFIFSAPLLMKHLSPKAHPLIMSLSHCI